MPLCRAVFFNLNIKLMLNKIFAAAVTTALTVFVLSSLRAQPVWLQTHSGPVVFGLDYALDIGVDKQGNIIVTGSSHGSGTGRDPLTIKYNSAGVQQWAKRMFAVGNNDESAYELAIDSAGNIYVCGDAFAPSNKNALILKYSPSGTELFNVTYDRLLEYDEFSDIALDDSSNIYVSGYAEGTTGSDIVIAKYSSTGVQRWIRFYTSPGAGSDAGYDITVDKQGNIYVCGNAKLSPGFFGLDAVVIKYDNAGNQKWVKTISGAANKDDYLQSIAVDNAGNVYAGGLIVEDSTHFFDYLLVKYDSAGSQQWIKKVDSPVHGQEQIRSIRLDNNANIYATGEYYEQGRATQVMTIKYNTSGTLEWMQTYSATNVNKPDAGEEIVLDNTGNIYTCGSFYPDSGFRPHGVIIKYNNSGVRQWAQTYNGGLNSTNSGADFYGIAVDSTGSPAVAGRRDSSGNYDFATLKYSATVSITPVSTITPSRSSLHQNYPNPFNPVTNFEFQIADFGHVRITVYDITGKEIASLVNKQLKPGTYKAEWNASNSPSGVYFYRLRAEGFDETKKMILIK
jgi:uncharacterized delta-60 repeat protein